MVVKLDVSRTKSVASNKLLVPGWALVLGIAGQHALDAHADALHILNWAPTLLTKEIETYEAVRVYVRMHGNRPIGELDKCDFRWFCRRTISFISYRHEKTQITYRIACAELELQPVRLIKIKRIGIQHFDVHEPLVKTFC